MKTLVTGATGFMGAKLCEALAKRGDQIRALVFPDEDYSHIKDYIAETVEGDITRPETLDGVGDGVEVVYHLAARVLDYGNRDEFYGIILDGTKNMLEACAGKSGRFVYISSICACGTGRHNKGMTEDDACVKTGVFYGDAKLDAEGLVKSYGDKFPKGYVIIRPANVTGPRSVWVNELGQTIRDSLFAYFDGGRHSASLIHIDNLVDGLVLAGSKEEAANRTYFFRDDWEVTWKRYVDDLANVLDMKVWLSLPFGVAWLLGGVAGKTAHWFNGRPVITRHIVGLMGRDNDVDTTRARTELGWKTRVSYEEAMAEIEKWVKENML